jgi:hypothetical protein
MLNLAAVAGVLAIIACTKAEAAPAVTEDQAAAIHAAIISSDSDQAPEWFPTAREDQALTLLAPSPMQSVTMDPSATLAVAPALVEHTVIPIPPAAWTGMLSLGAMSLVSCRKAIARFFT